MTAEDANIERIVREVVERLSAAETAETNGKMEEHKRTRDELVIPARVVTVSDLVALDGVKRLIVPPRAVITPAARDLLRVRGIDVAYTVRPARPMARLAVGSLEAGRDVAALIQKLTADGIEVQRLANTGLGTLVAELADLVARSGYFGMLWTVQTAAALCLANRHRGVRAVYGSDQATIRQAIEAVGANVLVVRPGSLSDFRLRRQIGEFCRNGQISCPAEYEKWLR
jgi:hypothetical protein